jgi:hypothetical protein
VADEPGNQTPNTPDISETALRATKVDELRREARKAGVEHASDLHKEDLVQAIVAAKEGGRSTSTSGEEPGNQTPNTPDVSETALRAKKVDALRKEAVDAGVQGASRLHKEELVHAVAQAESAGPDTGGEQDDLGAGPDGGHVRTGEQTSKSIRYSQEVTSPEDAPERQGRSLVTTHHEVIRQWADARNATPATVPGTEHGDHLGVLRLDFGNDNDDLRHVDWGEWFRTFDDRRLNFIYQEERTDGHTSTFFRLESPDREDG